MRWALLGVLMTGPAWAWPVDVVQDLEVGKEKFIHLSSLDWWDVEDPKVVTVEYMESGEILFTPLKPGRTLVLMYAEKKFAVWRLKVGPSSQPFTAALLKPCPKVEYRPDAYDKLTGTVTDEKCRQALLGALATDGFVGKELDLTYPVEVLQGQLKAINAGLAALKLKISARYEGASLVLTGATDLAGQKKALWDVFRKSAGRVAMDDQVEVALPADAGTVDAGSPGK